MLAAFCIVCGLVLLASWAYIVRVWFLSMRWDFALGTVRGSLIEPARSDDALRQVQGFKPVIRYAYDIDGQTYVSSRFSATKEPFFSEESDARAFIERFPHGAKLRVRVNPNNARQTVLERRLTFIDALPAYLAIGCIALGLLLV
ncbi:MAG: DUF3592 domain-containing protein [Pseudomonadota bacterium]